MKDYEEFVKEQEHFNYLHRDYTNIMYKEMYTSYLKGYTAGYNDIKIIHQIYELNKALKNKR